MSNLMDWLDVSGPEFDYLGHFRAHEWLCEGHNDLRMADQIEQGQIPDIHTGTNLPADAEPGNIADTSQGAAAGQPKPQAPLPSGMPPKGNPNSPLRQALTAPGEQDYSGGDAGPGGTSESSSDSNPLSNLGSGGIGNALGSIFGL